MHLQRLFLKKEHRRENRHARDFRNIEIQDLVDGLVSQYPDFDREELAKTLGRLNKEQLVKFMLQFEYSIAEVESWNKSETLFHNLE